tara:strand:+ start:41 stop:304 length:264 start_codon:yes stop_codon:yes gene_type:complete
MTTFTNQQMPKKEMDTVIKQIKEYHYKNTDEYMKKLEDSDTEEYWDEYVLFTDEEYMKNYEKMFIYSGNNIVNYKTKQPIKIKIIPV